MLIAAVIWYNQTQERLDRLVRSLGNGKCDAAVFLDGPFAGLSDVLESPREQYHWIADAAEEIGLQYAVLNHTAPWGSEPDKRTAAASAARLIEWEPHERRNEALGQEKWILVIDSDEWVESPEFNWALIEQQGTGTISLRNWKDGDWEHGTGDEAKMVRILPLLGGLVWGPSHYDVMDAGTGITLLGHDKGLTATNEPCAVFGHDVGAKVIAAEYEAYNNAQRHRHEGKVLRIREVSGEHVIVRMDSDQAKAEWRIGAIANFPATMMPEGYEAMQGYLVKIEPVEGDSALCDLYFSRRTEDEVKAIIAERREIEALASERNAALLARRKLKKQRKAERLRRRLS